MTIFSDTEILNFYYKCKNDNNFGFLEHGEKIVTVYDEFLLCRRLCNENLMIKFWDKYPGRTHVPPQNGNEDYSFIVL